MFIKYCVSLMVIIFSISSIYSQNSNLRSAYLSVHSGAFLTSVENFDKTYDSNYGFVYGIGLGLPTSSRSYLYAKVTRFAKSGTPIIRTYTSPTTYTESREGSANYTQWIYNGGFLYNFFLSHGWILGINGGVTYTSISEEQKSADGKVSSSLNGSGMLGYFIGALLEKNFDDSQFSVFVEPQYNYCRQSIAEILTNYGGINLNLGIRYYFQPRRKE